MPQRRDGCPAVQLLGLTSSPVPLVFLMFLLLQGKPPTKKAKVLHKAAWSAKIGAFLHSQGTGQLADGTLTGQDGECRWGVRRCSCWSHRNGDTWRAVSSAVLFLPSGTLPCTETMCVDCSDTGWQDMGHISLPHLAGANGVLVRSCPSTIALSLLLV